MTIIYLSDRLSTMSYRSASPILVISWLSLLMCVWTSGDRVFDLVFEEPNVTADAPATAEEPDNAAEHLLMPSPRAASSAGDTATTDPTADSFAVSIALSETDTNALRAASPRHPPPRSSPGSFSIPLRI